MKAFAAVTEGFESIAESEIRDLAKAGSIALGKGIITFESPGPEDLCRLAYRSQSISRLCAEIACFAAAPSLKDSLADLKKSLKARPAEWSDGSFAVECTRKGNHEFNSHDFEMAACRLLGKNADFKSPKARFYCSIDGDLGYFGIDVAGFDLSKRDYRIFGHSSDLKATAAYSLVRLAGYDLSKILADPFSRSGAIAIEAALFAAGFPVNYYRKDSFSFLNLKPFSGVDFGRMFAGIDGKIEKKKPSIFNYSSAMPHVKSAEKNAKIAGVNRLIKFSRVDMESLDLKFSRGDVDAIVSYPPFISRASDPGRIRKLYGEFFYQASYILKENGRIVLASREAESLSEAASKHGFNLSSENEFRMGEEKRLALTFAKS